MRILILLHLLGLAAFASEPRAIPLEQLGTQAAKQYSGDGIGVTPTATGARLRASFQDLEADATPEGLWLQSMADEDAQREVRFRLRATEVSGRRVEERGEVRVSTDAAAWLRPGLIEEYRVSTDGIRQDFVIPRKAGTSPLSVSLELTGARAEPAAYGAKLILDGNARELAYNRLHVTDATGRELTARMEVTGAERIEIQVDDAGAVYPVRIDPTFSDADWVAMATSSGLDDEVFALTFDSAGNLYIGGRFTTVGGISALHIAKWNGSTWSALGSGIAKDVYVMATFRTNLYVGGVFFGAGGSNADYIAKWDGTAWSSLGTGVNNPVHSLAVDGEDLYAGGSFTMAGGVSANRVAKWNGTAWSPLGSGCDNLVSELAVSGSNLIAGGSFTSAGGLEAHGIAMWNGNTWSAMGLIANSSVSALAVDGNDLYAGGTFPTADGTAIHRVVKWNGSTWSPLGSGIEGTVRTLAFSGASLYAGGNLILSGGGDLAKWDGSSWSIVGNVGDRNFVTVYALGVMGNEVFAGGRSFSVSEATSHLAKWTGTSWAGVGPGINGAVRTIASSGSDLFIGGDFTSVAGRSANRIAKWNGSSWTSLGSGMDGTVMSLVVSGTDLYSAGWFTTAGGVSASRIAKWNGTSWSPLGVGLNGTVNSLAVSGNVLYAGGNFTLAGPASANCIAKWDGSTWSALGSGIGDPGIVYAVAVVGTDVYAGGAFSSAGGIDIGYGFAKWNGSAWSAIGTGVNGPVYAFAVSGTDLYLAGDVHSGSGSYASRMAKWDGSSWSSVGNSFTNGAVRALVVVGTDLYAGGEFSQVDGQSAPYIAKWDGNTWSPIGSGMDDNVLALAASETRLFAGGAFLTAGAKFSPRLASLNLLSSGPSAEIAVSGNVTNLVDGDSTPAIIDHTDFAAASLTGATVTRTFTISNQGQANLTLGIITIGGTAAADFTVSSTPASPVTVGGSTTFQITFDPSVAGTRSATVSFATNDSDEDPFNFSIQGYGAVPEIAVSGNGTSITDGDATPSTTDHTDFGTAGVTGWTIARTFTISNSGTADLTLGTITLGGTHSADFTVTTPPASTIAPGGSTTFTVTFDPANLGMRSATLSFSTNDSDANPFNFSIQGAGAASLPEIVVSGSGFDIADGSTTPTAGNGTYFQSVPTASGSVTRFYTITNTGYANLNLGTVTIGGPHAAEFILNSQPGVTVTPGATTTFQVTFDPSAEGPRSATLSFTTNDADENPFNFSIGGTGLPAAYPEIAVTGNNVNIEDGDASPSTSDHTDFGNCAVTGATVTRTFTISNSGNDWLTVNSLSFTGTNASEFTVSAAPGGTIAANGSTTFQIRFDPSGTGLRTATLSFNNSDADEHPFNFSIQGTGTAPEIAVTGNDVDIATGDTTPAVSDHTDFGIIQVAGQTITRTFTISNSGTANLTLGSVSFAGTNSGDFTVAEAPSSTVLAGAITTLKVRFAPLAAGTRSATLSFATNDPNENPFTFAITGSEPATDTDTNGFTDAEEAAIAALRTRYAVGETVDLDLSFLRLSPSQYLAITGLPPGVIYNSQNRHIEGTITGELGDVSGEIRKLDGPTLLARRLFNLSVAPYPFLGSFEALLESGSLPVGKARLTITGPGVFSATLERQGQPSRTTRGTFTPSGGETQSVPVTFPLFKGSPETVVTFVISSTSDLVTGTNAGATLRGFRLAKPGRSPLQRVTVAFENTVPGNRTTTPGGSGFANGSLSAAGLLSLSTTLGDGQAATIGLNLSQTNQAVVFAQPYSDKAQSFFGGILTIGDLGAPSRGGSSESQTAGLQWRRAPVATALSYPAGFGTAVPLQVNGRVSRWIPVTTAEGLALSLGLNLRQIEASYIAPQSGILPSRLGLRNTFALVRLLPANSVLWTGKSVASNGTFSGTLAKNPVSGVLLQDASFGTQIGIGLVRIPVSAPLGQPALPRGSFETSGLFLEND